MGTRRVTTPIFRASYINLLSPRENEKGTAWYYSVTMIFDPTQFTEKDKKAWEEMKAIYHEAVQDKWKTDKPGYIINPFRRGEPKSEAYQQGFDLAKNPEYTDKIIVSANGYTNKLGDGSFDPTKKIGIVGPDGKEYLNPAQANLYSGMFGRAEISMYVPKNSPKGPMVAVGLHNFQKCADGDPLGGGSNGNAEEAFEAFVQPSAVGENYDLLGI